jgi:hypothetical protein
MLLKTIDTVFVNPSDGYLSKRVLGLDIAPLCQDIKSTLTYHGNRLNEVSATSRFSDSFTLAAFCHQYIHLLERMPG